MPLPALHSLRAPIRAAALSAIGAHYGLFADCPVSVSLRQTHNKPGTSRLDDASNAAHASRHPDGAHQSPRAQTRGNDFAPNAGVFCARPPANLHADAPADKDRAPAAGNRFLEKLGEMENLAALKAAGAAGAAQSRGSEEDVLKERERMLVFRDVGMDLDKPILSRDVFLVLKYFRYGIEFAVDNELERMLRYFNEHALNELKIIQNSKLMRGPALLSRKKCPTNRKGVFFQAPPLFPLLRAANMRLFCTYTKEVAQKVDALITASSLGASFCRGVDGDVLSFTSKPRYFCEQDSTQMTSFSSSAFRRPAVIIYSQLGQKLGAQADLEWRRLAYATIYPSLLQHIFKTETKSDSHSVPRNERHRGGLRNRSKETSAGSTGARAMPIDVISLRSMDVYKYRWVHRLYVRRFARSLVPRELSLKCSDDKPQIDGLLTASTTFVGCKLLQPFYSVLGLRNYLSPYVMLVDHEGVIRWLTAGLPDDYERAHFSALLKQLEEEYYSRLR